MTTFSIDGVSKLTINNGRAKALDFNFGGGGFDIDRNIELEGGSALADARDSLSAAFSFLYGFAVGNRATDMWGDEFVPISHW